MFCSTVIPTVGRLTLTRAVESVLKQSFTADAFEVIVVNDSGRPLAPASWQQSARVTVLETNDHERAIARNLGAAVAQGRYLHFLDDDDWLAPNALQHFWEQRPADNAIWLYGASQLVDREGHPLVELRHDLHGNCFLQAMAGEWIPLQASLIASEAFFEIGGFNPLLSGPEDIDLLRRIALHYEITGIEPIVAFIERGEEDSTTDYDRHAQLSRWAREQILEEDACFSRLRSSAGDPFWWGRVVRLYVTSVVWNVQQRRILTAISRGSQALAAGLLAGRDTLVPAFWRSFSRPYQSEAFARGQAQAARSMHQ